MSLPDEQQHEEMCFLTHLQSYGAKTTSLNIWMKADSSMEQPAN